MLKTMEQEENIKMLIYLHCPSSSQLLISPAMIFFFKSDTEKHLKLWSRAVNSEEDERSFTPSLENCCDELSEEKEAESSLVILRLGM